jgi:hypothetical protein
LYRSPDIAGAPAARWSWSFVPDSFARPRSGGRIRGELQPHWFLHNQLRVKGMRPSHRSLLHLAWGRTMHLQAPSSLIALVDDRVPRCSPRNVTETSKDTAFSFDDQMGRWNPTPSQSRSYRCCFRAPAGNDEMISLLLQRYLELSTWILSFYPSSHSPDLLLVQELLETRIEVLPPLEQHRFANELEPWRELQLGILEESLQILGRDIFCILDLVLVDVEVNIGLDEQDVVDYWGKSSAHTLARLHTLP